jgi:Bacterial Ig domain
LEFFVAEMKLKLWLLAFSMILLSAPAALACRVPLIRTFDNQTVTGWMFATSGRQCSIILTYSHGPIFTTALVSNARNGTVAVTGGRVVYTPRAGFVGDDEFTYARRGLNSHNEPIVRTVNVTVKFAAK